MGDFNLAQVSRLQALPVPAFITVPHSASANTKGSYTQLIAATDFPWRSLAVFVQADLTGSFSGALTDIAIGAPGSELIILPNLFSGPHQFGGFTIFSMALIGNIPIPIPAGTRIAARGQNSGGGVKNSYVGLMGFSGGDDTPVLGRADALGVSTATSRGTQVTTSASASVKGSWVEIAASTAFHIRWLYILGGRMQTLNNFGLDVGIGAIGAEVVIVPDVLINPFCGSIYGFPVAVPAGSRLAVRAACAAAGAQSFDVSLLVMG